MLVAVRLMLVSSGKLDYCSMENGNIDSKQLLNLKEAMCRVRRFGIEFLDKSIQAYDFIHEMTFPLTDPEAFPPAEASYMRVNFDVFGSLNRAKDLLKLKQDQWPIRFVGDDFPEAGLTWSAFGLSQLYISGVLQCLSNDGLIFLIDVNINLLMDETYFFDYAKMPLPLQTFRDYHRENWDPDLVQAIRHWDQCFVEALDQIHKPSPGWPYVRFPL